MEKSKTKLDEHRAAVRKLRTGAGVSMKELGKRAGLSESAISRFETGMRELSYDAYKRVVTAINDIITEREAATTKPAKALGLPLSSLVFGPPLSSDYALKQELKQLREENASLKRQVESLEHINKHSRNIERISDEQIATLTDLAKTYKEMPDPKVLDRVKQLEASNKELRDLLGLEIDATVTRGKANEKREEVREKFVTGKGNECP